MHNNKALAFLSASLFIPCSLFITVPVQAADGEQLFQQHCSRCHQSAKRIKTPADQISALLALGNIRAHRFTLDEATIQTIVDYIGQQPS